MRTFLTKVVTVCETRDFRIRTNIPLVRIYNAFEENLDHFANTASESVQWFCKQIKYFTK